MIQFKIEPYHKEYLAVQRGDISHLLHDSAAWRAAYDQAIEDTYQSIRPFLPDRCEAFLDIGAGMGGIDVAVAKHYGYQPTACLLDGDAAPVVRRQDVPFSDGLTALDFLRSNDVVRARTYAPHSLPKADVAFDLIMSFASWCFHYWPQEYLEMVLRSSRKGTVVIIDVRIARPAWLEVLVKHFGKYRVAHESKKYQRLVFTL